MPLSFQGFGALAILTMLLIQVVAQGIGYIKARRRPH
jgi:hypothetical protein